MKLIPFLLLFVSATAWSQIPIPNNTVFNSMNLCFPTPPATDTSGDFSQSWDVPELAVPCEFNPPKLYYYFETPSNSAGSSSVFQVEYSGTFEYVYYGPFNTLTEGQNAVSLGTAPIISNDTTTTSYTESTPLEADKYYILLIKPHDCSGTLTIECGAWHRRCSGSPIVLCDDCLPSFTPGEKKFVVSAWVSEGAHPNTKTTFSTPAIQITDNSTSTTYTFHPSGQVIDGWQRIEGIFTGPTNGDMTLTFVGGSEDSYFDDIRIFPNDGSMMSYVYDPLTLRLVAELDERNYAKFYEYDEEGKLVRVKKETEQGIMTIQENRENSSLKPSEP